MSLMDKLLKSGASNINASILADSPFFGKKDVIHTDLPILNIAFSGDIDGGIVSGLTTIGGESKSFKTLIGLYCMKAYLNKYKDGIGLIYDSEFSITPEYLSMNGIDPQRVLHVPVEHLEQLKFDFVKRLAEIKRGDKVFILIDSVGGLGSVKEVTDALEEKGVSDMTRAKSIRGLLRIITPLLTTKDIPCFGIYHTYKEMALYPKTIVGGGTAPIFFSNQVFIISKAQEKNAKGELEGFKFTINIEKSRFVREKSKLPFTVSYENGIDKYSSMLDLALESKDVIKPSNGWYQLVDPETGEVLEPKVREAATSTDKFLGVVIKRPGFKQFVIDKFKLDSTNFTEDTEPEEVSELELLLEEGD